MEQTVSKTIKLRSLGAGGLNTDLQPWELGAEFISEGNNFRVVSGAITNFGGHKISGTDLPPGFAPGHLAYVNAELDVWLCAGNDKIYSYDGTTWVDVTGPAMSVDNKHWMHTQLGRLPILNNSGDHPRVMTPATHGQALQYLQWDAGNTWSDASKSCRSIRSFRNYLIALDMTESGARYPDVIRWSHPADSGGLPVSWDDTDPNYRANKVVLAGDGGSIMDGLPLRDGFCIYRERGMAILDYTGGDFVFNIRSLTNTANLININSIAEVKGAQIAITEGDVVLNDGNQIKSLMHDRIRRRFAADFNESARDAAFVVHHRERKEIWCCIPTQTETVANFAWVWDYSSDRWYVRGLPDVISADYGPSASPQRTWDNWLDTWDTSVGPWNLGIADPFDSNVIAINNEDPARIISLDYGNDQEIVTSFIERLSFPIEDHSDAVSVQEIHPFIRGNTPVEIQIGAQKAPGAAVSWKPWQVFRPGIDRKLDIRCTGVLLSWRVRCDGDFTLTGMDLHVASAGRR